MYLPNNSLCHFIETLYNIIKIAFYTLKWQVPKLGRKLLDYKRQFET